MDNAPPRSPRGRHAGEQRPGPTLTAALVAGVSTAWLLLRGFLPRRVQELLARQAPATPSPQAARVMARSEAAAQASEAKRSRRRPARGHGRRKGGASR